MKYLIHEIEFISDRPNLLLVSFKLERCVLLKKLLMERGEKSPSSGSLYTQVLGKDECTFVSEVAMLSRASCCVSA